MNPSTALATVVVDELLRGGVREAVLSPGSRNAPLSFALHAADRAGRLRLHVRIDERTAGFLALGLAKASGRPVPVVTTSGTAAVNLHPAVVEAEYAHVALIALTADRPLEMRGVGANQTIDQLGLYGGSVAYSVDLSIDYPSADNLSTGNPSAGNPAADNLSADNPAADNLSADNPSVDNPGSVRAWRTAVRRALAHGQRAPVHVNIAFREPLVPDDDLSWQEPLDADPAEPRIERGAQESWDYQPLAAGGRTVVVAGDSAIPDARLVAESGGWPLLAEPSSGHRAGPNALAAYRLYLDRLGGEIERVVVAGRPTLSRPVTALLARDDVEVVRLRDDPRTPLVTGAADEAWLKSWTSADRAAREALTQVLADHPSSGPAVARVVAAATPPGGLLVAGSSSPIRDLDLADPWDEPPLVLANRGASGIDGTVSTAIGAALAHGGPAYALIGDLTFLHDSTGLVIGPDEPRPDLTVVVVNDDGGGLFTLLEQGAPAHAVAFERIFGTPHGVDLAALCAATGTPYARADSLRELRDQLEPGRGIRVVEVRTDRRETRDLHSRLRAAVHAALR